MNSAQLNSLSFLRGRKTGRSQRVGVPVKEKIEEK
jgi:hypothetical protein